MASPIDQLGGLREVAILVVIIAILLAIGSYIGQALENETNTTYMTSLLNKINDPISIGVVALVFIMVLELLVNTLSGLGKRRPGA